MFVYELIGCGFESSCSHLNFRFRSCFEQGVPWHSGNYRVWIHSETRAWHDKTIQLKSVDIIFKTISLQCSWVKQLFDSSTYDMKLNPSRIVTQKLGKKFLFHSNLYIDPKKIRQFPNYFQEITKWRSTLSAPPKTYLL